MEPDSEADQDMKIETRDELPELSQSGGKSPDISNHSANRK
jgi:hypothetical protein